jgi:galactokinase
MNLTELKKQFSVYYENNNNLSVFFAPGRVNLIGEHTDYNGGYVFPCALSFGTYLLCRKTSDNVIKFASTNFALSKTVPLDELTQKQGDSWVNYPLGVINQFIKKGCNIPGFEFLFAGNVPNGAGLSSSASIEMVTATALNNILSTGFEQVELAKISQKAENEFVGVNCGIMDQFASGLGKKDYAIALKCDTLDYELVPLKLNGNKLIIANTNKHRGLTDSKYNERRRECENAVGYLSKQKPYNFLCEIDLKTFNKNLNLIPNPVIVKRAKHVISENERVLKAIETLKAGDLNNFGKLMNESHDSLRYDYEVTGFELDTLVEEARKIPGVLGSRMTGAGFGGCTVNLVKESAVDTFIIEVGKNYALKANLIPDFYVAEIGDGARRIE